MDDGLGPKLHVLDISVGNITRHMILLVFLELSGLFKLVRDVILVEE